MFKNLKSNKLILLRHAESLWNKENIYTGWYNIQLTEKGIKQSENLSHLILSNKLIPDIIYTSEQLRANETTDIIKNNIKALKNIDVPVEKTWRLNEKHYGQITGLNKTFLKKTYGNYIVKQWTNTYEGRAPILQRDNIGKYILKNIPPYSADLYLNKIHPFGESYEQVHRRMIPYFNNVIMKSIRNDKNVMIISHSNTLKVLIKYLENINKENIHSIEVDNATPIIYEYTENLQPSKLEIKNN
jgi:2,3-bisphosphoglycerate-dependent phosphoglycerate mutase